WLKPGMTANVDIVTDQRADVLKVPTAALRFKPPARDEDGGGAAAASGVAPGASAAGRDAKEPPHVYRLAGRDPAPVNVRTGIADEMMTEIESHELQPGDRVVVRIKPSSTAQPVLMPSVGGPRRR